MVPIERDTGYRCIESTQNTTQLISAARILYSHKQQPEEFWKQEHLAIAERLGERFSVCPEPENEIIIPTHKNGIHLPTLLHGLSLQDLRGLGPTQLTFLMHNNSGANGNKQDTSWDILKSLQDIGTPINIMELSDPLLTGPLASYQFALAKNKARKACLILDADSIPIPSWVRNLTRPLQKDENILISGGQRLLLDAPPTVAFPSAMFYLLTTGQYIFHHESPDLIGSSKFYGGQAAYNGPFFRKYIHNILGLPEGDEMLGRIVRDEFGEMSFQFANSPVINIPDHYRNPRSMSDYFEKIRKASTAVLPKELSRRVLPKKSRLQYADYKLMMTHRYCPWSRDIIEAFQDIGRTGTFTPESVVGIFDETAKKQGFKGNEYVQEFLKKGITCFTPSQPLDGEAVYAALCNIGLHCLKPTLEDHIGN